MIQEKIQKQNHSVIMEDRKSLTVSGVTDVDSFDEKTICLYTVLGEMTIHGKNLHIDSMSVDSGDMAINGDIWSIIYGDKDRKGPLSIIGRLFR